MKDKNFYDGKWMGKIVMGAENVGSNEGFTIFRNHRTEPNDFSMEYPCHFCDDFVPTAIKIPGTHFQICSSCLNKMQEAINKFVVSNFKKDFEESKKGNDLCGLA